jgi:DNA polymerase III epsilon subunit-like protein
LDYFCIDVEASGPVPGHFNLLSVGCAHVRRYQGVYQRFDDLYVELRPIFPGFDPAAMAVNRLDADRLRAEALTPERAMARVVEWIEDQRHGKKDRPVFVAHNAPFDWMYFAFYCVQTGVPNPFGHSALDTKALAMGRLGISWNQTSLKNVTSLLPEVQPQDPDLLHHAGEDARYLARVFAALMNRGEPAPPAPG